MQTIPKIGQRVRYLGSDVIDPCEGVVTLIVKDCDPETGEEIPFDPNIWSVRLKPDILPPNWPYPGHIEFVPYIKNIQPA